MATTTQGLAIALFGAYAGGYTAQLDADIAKSGLAPVASSLVGLQGPLLGLNLNDNAAWIDLTLGNLGVDSTNAAYSAAKAWFEGALPSLGRGGAVAAAVNYLLGSTVDTAYTSVAKAFAANVAAGATYSATTAGAAELNITNLQNTESANPAGVAGTVGFNLTAALNTLKADKTAKTAFLDSLDLDADGKLDTAAAPAGNAVTAANEETAVATNLTTAATNFNNNGFSVQDYSVGATAAVNSAAYTLARASAASAETTASAAVDSANKAIDKTIATDAEIAAYSAAKTADTAANKAAVSAYTDLLAQQAAFNVKYNGYVGVSSETFTETTVGSGNTDTAAQITTLIGGWNGVKDAAGTPADLIVASSTAGVFKVADAVTTAATVQGSQTSTQFATSKLILAEVQKLLTAYQGAYDALVAAKTGQTTLDSSTTALGTEQAHVDALLTAQTNLATAKTNTATLETLISKIGAAEALTTQLASLNTTITKDGTAITNGGWTLDVIGTDNATAGNDVFVFDGKTGGAITGFGTAGNDVIKFAAGNYTLTTVKAADWNAKAVGSATTLEIFVVDNGAKTDLYVEKNAFDGSTTSAQLNTVDITLTGVTGKTVSLTADGYLHVA